jgi:hypothetical protein
MAFFSLYVIPYIGSREINHVRKAIEESFNQQPYMCIRGRGSYLQQRITKHFVFVQVQNIFRSQLFIFSHFLQYLSKCY